MIYFPPPNIEFTPNIEVSLGSIRTASTGSTDANQLFCDIAPGEIGDKIIVFCHAKYPNSTVLLAIENDPSGVNSLDAISGYGYVPTSGQVNIKSRISNGKEVRVRAYTENSSTLSSIALLTVRITGDHSSLVSASYYSGTSTFSPSVSPSINMAQKPFIENYIYFTALGRLSGSPYYTSSDLPTAGVTQNLLGVVNTANTSLILGYSKSTDPSLSLNASWTDNSASSKMGNIAYIQADKRFIGDTLGRNTSSTGAYLNSNSHKLLIYPHFLKKASGYEEIYEFVFESFSYSGTPDGVFEIGLYDVTNGYSNAPLCVSASTNKIIANKLNVIPITPYKLTAGNSYAVGFRSSISNTAPSAAPSLGVAYAGNFAVRNGSLTGTSALGATWSDAGTTVDSRYAVGANVRYTPAKSGYKIINNTAIAVKNKLDTKAPNYPAINTGNPITRGLSILYVPSAGPINVATLQRSTGGANRRRGASSGFALNDSRIDLPYPTGKDLTKEITILAIANISGFQSLIQIYDSAGIANNVIDICRNDSTTMAWQNTWDDTAGTVRASHSASGFWEAGKAIVGITARKNSGSNQFHRYYKNGKFFGDGTSSAAHGNSGSNSVRIGEQTSGGNRATHLYMLAVWSRALTDVELASISRNPYQILKPIVGDQYYLEQSLINDYYINAVDIDNQILVGQIKAQLTGKNLALLNRTARLRYDGVNLPVQNYSPGLITTFDVPQLTDFFSSGLPLGTVKFDILKDDSS